MLLRPFWQYYGGKWRAAPYYPAPMYRRIVEPFAGSAGYALRYPDNEVVLVEKNSAIAEMWRFLICAPVEEIRKIPLVKALDELPAWVPEGARTLVGFNLTAASTHIARKLSAGCARAIASGKDPQCGWSERQRARAAMQAAHIRHWKIIEGDYTLAPEGPATWFVDPPYNNRAGKKYPVGRDLNYESLATWCRARRGQVLVCENAGASWLPFQTFRRIRSSNMSRGATGWSEEVLWTNT